MRIRLRFDPFRDRHTRLKVLARDHYTCRWCGRPGDTLEHLIPWSQGGRTTMTNCVCACQECNNERGDLPAEEFARLKGVQLPRPTGNEPVPKILVRRGLQSTAAHELAVKVGIVVTPETVPLQEAEAEPARRPTPSADSAERAAQILRMARLLEARNPLLRRQLL